jgi:hypothetical protein
MVRYQGSLCRLVLLLLVPLFTGNAQFSFPIIATDGAVVDTIIIGTSPVASYGIDITLGESELPPITPPGVFDVRCVDFNGRTGLGNGVSTEFRPLTSPLQSDTFRISFRSGLSGGSVQFLWPEHLAGFGAGRWRMVDVLGLGIVDIDMNAQTSLIVPTSYVPDPIAGGSVYIIVQDSAKFRTFTMDSLALDGDLKGKQRAEKRKGIASRWRFKFVNTTGQDVNGLVVKYNQAVTGHIAYSPFMAIQGENTKTIAYSGQVILQNQELSIEGFGNKGKAIKAKAYWTFDGERIGDRFDPVVEDIQIQYPMPNVHNLGEELFTSGAFTPGGLIAGVAGNPRSVVHDKYKKLMKTLVKKGILHTGLPTCLDSLDNGKPFKKAPSSLPPTAHNNRLLAEQVTLKFNIAASDAGRTPHGFGDLLFTGEASPLNGMAIRSIAVTVDTVLSCIPLSPGPMASMTFDEWLSTISLLNGSFSGVFDTASWTDSLVLTGARYVSDIGFLTRGPETAVTLPHPHYRSFVEDVPTKFSLGQNYPNPFNPSTTISFELPFSAIVTLTVTNVLGQTIALLADHEEFDEGETEVEFDGASLSSGAYYYRLTAESTDGSGRSATSQKKMMLMK